MPGTPSAVELAVAAIAIVLGVAFLVYVITARSPERLAGHERPPDRGDRDTIAQQLYRGSERPAGPDAEEQRPN